MQHAEPRILWPHICIALLLAATVTAAANADEQKLSATFDDTPPGEPPDSVAYIDDATEGELRIVDSETTPADPFGGEGNRSLYVTDAGNDNHMPRFAWRTEHPIEDKARVSISFFQPGADKDAGTVPALVSMRIGQQWRDENGKPGVLVTAGPNIALRWDGKIRYKTEQHTTQLAQSFPSDAPHTLAITVDLEKQEWSGTLDGVQLTGYRGEQTRFPFHKSIERVDAIELRVGRWKQRGHHAFFDDITISTDTDTDPDAPKDTATPPNDPTTD